MKIFNTIALFDCYIVAETPEAAREILIKAIRDNAELFKPHEETAREVRNEREIRATQRDVKPLVGDDVSDKDFAKLKGKTVIDIFKMLYTKESPK